MGLEATAVPLAFLAGVVGVLSPCVWPLVPVVMSSASMSGKSGPYWLAGGMSLSFAVAGTGLTFLLVQAGIDPEFFRHVAAMLLIVAAAFLLVPVLKDWASRALSGGLGRLGLGGAVAGDPGSLSSVGQFGTGVLLGVVWLPCVGPTLGAAIALASMGSRACRTAWHFVVMLAPTAWARPGCSSAPDSPRSQRSADGEVEV
jgi:cytochrome c-type biogenesis protein